MNEGNSLTIWGQSQGSGKLIATGKNDWFTGIGNDSQSNKCGTIIINGGTIDATGGGWTAGIGGEGATITINGGNVKASGGNNGAGIGGVSSGSQGFAITITGGTVDAHGAQNGAGIGNGAGSTGENEITITGGFITADSENGPAISGDFSTETDGTAVIVYDFLDDTTTGDDWSGIFISGSGTEKSMDVYGNQTLAPEISQKLPSVTLKVKENASLTVAGGAELKLTGDSVIAGNGNLVNSGTITNNGTVTNNGSVENQGEIVNHGSISGDGSFTGDGTITENPLRTSCELIPQDLRFSVGKNYTPSEMPIEIYNSGPEKAVIEKIEVQVDAQPFVSSDQISKVFEIIQGTSTVEVEQTNTSWKIKPVEGLPVGLYAGTITITYNGIKETNAVAFVTFMVFLNGDGTQSAPFLISDQADLKAFRAYIKNGYGAGQYFKLTDDIDLNGSESDQWTPIDDFSGTFDGNGHTIRGLYINQPDKSYQGLFSTVREGGVVKNLTVEGSVTCGSYGASIVGDNQGTVENCHNACKVVSEEYYCGGVVGYNNGTVKNCYNTGNISGGNGSSAIVANNDNGTVTNCYYLLGTAANGIGVNKGTGDATEKTDDQFASGEVTWLLQNGQEKQVWGQTLSTDNCPVLTSDTAKTVYKVTFLLDGAEHAVMYANPSGLAALPAEPSKSGFTFAGWSKTNGGPADFIKDSPVSADTTVYAVWNIDFTNSGTTESNPYLIPNLEILKAFRNYVNAGNDCKDKFFKLTADINLGGADNQWTPIGNNPNEFKGNFDGGGHTISLLYISGSSNYQGLFGYIGAGGTVKNLGVSGSVISDSVNGLVVGSIAGQNLGTIENCHNAATVTCNGYCVGGIVGDNDGTVTNCYNTGAVTTTSDMGFIGGIVGDNGGTVTNCYNTGDISGNETIGGIVGVMSVGSVTNCYNTGNISGNDAVGGIVGVTSGGTVTNCYYLDTATSGVGYGDSAGTTAKNEAEFNSGEVAWLLQNGQDAQIWGQSLKDSPDEYPVLTNAPEKKVCKVTFHAESKEEYAVKYANYNGKVELPDNPTLDGAVFDHWSTVKDVTDGEKFDNNTAVTADITVYAVGRETFSGESDEIALTTTYGEELTKDLSESIAYKSGTETTGKFEYRITSGNDLLKATIEGDNLKIPGNANTGDYTLTIEAEEKVPQYSLMSVGSYGTTLVTLTVKMKIEKAEPVVAAPTGIAGLVYNGTEQNLVTAGSADGGEIQYSLDKDTGYSTDIPKGTEANEYTVWYKVVGDENHNDTAPQTLTISISKAAASVTVQAVTGKYGEDITVTAKVTVSSVAENPVSGTIEFKAGGTSLGTANVVSGTATLTVLGSERDKQHALFGADGSSTVTAAYNGNGNIEDGSDNGTAIIEPRELQYTVTAEDKTSDGKPDISVTLTPSNALSGDQLSLTAEGAVESPAAGTYNTVNLTDITLSGEDARYYMVETEKTGVELTSPVNITGENTGALQGKVTQGGKPVANATVTLKQGGKTVAATATGADGSYSFETAAPGVYDVVVEAGGKTMTSMVTITDKTGTEKNLELPTENVSSVLDTQKAPDSIVAVGGLDGEASENAVAGSTVTVTMTVESKTESNAEHAREIKSVAGGRELDYMAIELEKETTTGGTTKEEPLTETTQPITIVLRFDFTGKDNVVVYRYHGTAVDTLTETANSNGESIVLDEAGGTITLHVKNFSTYAIGYTLTGQTPTPSGPFVPPLYGVAVPSNPEGGRVKADRAAALPGSRVTLTVKPDEGYHFGSLTVHDRNGKAVKVTDNGDGTYTFTMPYGKVTVKAAFVKCGSLSFTDLDTGAWYHDYADHVIAHGLMQGIGGGLFAPDGTVSRAQMVMVLWNMRGKPVVNYYMTYSDVSEGVWYTEAIRWATSEGIAVGYDNGKFGPDDPITREQMAAMVYRYERKYGDGGFTGDWMYRLPFTDLDQISDWAYESVAWCNMKGVVTGKGNNIFDPQGPAKRSELASVLTRYCDENDIK